MDTAIFMKNPVVTYTHIKHKSNDSHNYETFFLITIDIITAQYIAVSLESPFIARYNQI
jgi:hypothetical protein